MKITKGKVIKDILLSIVGSFIITAVLQLMVYPYISSQMTTSHFGSILTLMGFSNTVASIFGGSLNNIRLIKQDYYKLGRLSDFGVLIYRMNIMATILMIIVIMAFKTQINFMEAVSLIVATIFLILRNYMNVYYRINLDYGKIIIHLLFTGLGYIAGILIFKHIMIWPVVFCLGEICAFIYAYKTTEFKNEKRVKSDKFNEINRDFIQLSSSNCISSLLLYLDRIIINPILGPANVALYYIASLVGKTVGIVLNPIASIILTYLSKFTTISKRKVFYILSLISIIAGSVIYCISVPITPIIIKILYPNDFLEAQRYFNFANLSVIVMICGSLINPIVLKNAPMWWQNVIQILYCILYLGLSIVLMYKYSLYGFCIAGIISNVARLLLIEGVAYYYTAN